MVYCLLPTYKSASTVCVLQSFWATSNVHSIAIHSKSWDVYTTMQIRRARKFFETHILICKYLLMEQDLPYVRVILKWLKKSPTDKSSEREYRLFRTYHPSSSWSTVQSQRSSWVEISHQRNIINWGFVPVNERLTYLFHTAESFLTS